MANKYHAKKVVYNGITFDSRKELQRYHELKLLERCGDIENLERQVAFTLIPAQYTPTAKTKGKLAERKVEYIADFVYTANGETVVEDVKGYRGGAGYGVFVIKRKLMLWVHGIRIKEV